MSRSKLCLPLFVLSLLAAQGGSAFAQVRFDTEWLFWHRNNDSETPLISGPNAVSSDDASFEFQSGYRFTLGVGVGAFDIEATFSQIPDWVASDSGILANPLVFDDSATDPDVFPGTPGNSVFIGSALFAAGTTIIEQNESEQLEAGAQVRTRYSTKLDNFELNVGSNRERYPWRFALGWRHLELEENSSLTAIGTFQAIDLDDAALPGGAGNDPNDQLSDAALLEAGFTLISGAGGGFAGYDPTLMPTTPTTMAVVFSGRSHNDLDGAQVVFGGQLSPSSVVIVEGFLKLGLYHNRAEGTVRETLIGIENDDSVYQRTLHDSDTTASFVGGLGFRVLVPVTDYIRLTTGYEALVVTNVALAPDQAQGVRTNIFGDTVYHVVTNGDLLAHGGNLGLEITW